MLLFHFKKGMGLFTYHLPDHRQEYIIISVVPDKLIVLKEHERIFVDDLCKQVL